MSDGLNSYKIFAYAVLVFFFLSVIISGRPDGLLLLVLCPLLLLVMISSLWSLSLRPSRDLSALMFILGGSCLWSMAFRNQLGVMLDGIKLECE